MKRNSPIGALLLILPCAFVLLAGFGVTRWRESERKAHLAFYSHPFKPQLQLGRGKVPGYSSSRLFEAKVLCRTSGAHGDSRWFIRGTLVTSGKKPSREIWNSQKLLDPAALSVVVSANVTGSTDFHGTIEPEDAGPFSATTLSWRFCRINKDAENLRLIVEAVAIPLPVAEANLGLSRVNVKEATPSQIFAAKQQPNATYLRESIELNARDDSKHHFSRDAGKS